MRSFVSIVIVSASLLLIGVAPPAPKTRLVAKTSSLQPTTFTAPKVKPVIQQVTGAAQKSGEAAKKTLAPERAVSPGGSGDLLDRIAQCESGGNYTAQNRSSTASGKYQYLDSSWGGYGGYQHAKDAPPSVQDQKARQDYQRSGSSPWAASRGCWG